MIRKSTFRFDAQREEGWWKFLMIAGWKVLFEPLTEHFSRFYRYFGRYPGYSIGNIPVLAECAEYFANKGGTAKS